jgi:hypothetical protein
MITLKERYRGCLFAVNDLQINIGKHSRNDGNVGQFANGFHRLKRVFLSSCDARRPQNTAVIPMKVGMTADLAHSFSYP